MTIMSTPDDLLDRLVSHAQSIGYEVVISDTSGGQDALPASLVFIKAPTGHVYSVSVERMS